MATSTVMLARHGAPARAARGKERRQRDPRANRVGRQFFLELGQTSRAKGRASVPAALHGVLEHLSGLRIESHFMGDRALLDIEGIAQATAAAFMLQLFVDDVAIEGLERDL